MHPRKSRLPRGPHGQARGPRVKPLAPTPTRWLSCCHAAPGSRSGAGGDTNLAPRGSETETRRSLRSPTCLHRTRSRDAFGLNASRLPPPLQFRGNAESGGTSGNHDCHSLAPPTGLDVGTTSPMRPCAATPAPPEEEPPRWREEPQKGLWEKGFFLSSGGSHQVGKSGGICVSIRGESRRSSAIRAWRHRRL